MPSLLAVIIYGNILLGIMNYVFKNHENMINIGLKVLPVFIILIAIRLCLPFEYFFSLNLAYPLPIAKIIDFLWLRKVIKIYNWEISIWQIMEFIWAVGIIYKLYELVKNHKQYIEYVKKTENVTNNEKYFNLVEKICNEKKIKNVFRIYLVSNISSPMIMGLVRPIIILPNDYETTDRELEFIIKHEIMHYIHHDLWIKVIIEILCILYWWNPMVSILRKQTTTLLEIKVDENIVRECNESMVADYMECLIKNAQKSVVDNKEKNVATAFNSGNEALMIKRFKIMAKQSDVKINKKKRIKLFLVLALVYILSLFVVFIPSYTREGSAEGTVTPTKDNAYLIRNNGGYDLYIDDFYWEHMDEIYEGIPWLPKYDSIEEAKNAEKVDNILWDAIYYTIYGYE